MSQILLVNDFVSRAKIAGNMMDPVLSSEGHDVYFLPTALISHNFSLGNVASLDTNTYIKESLDAWTKLNFKFDLIFIGYIANLEQKNLIIDYIKSINNEALVILDPIMGDDGSLYKGLSEEKIEIYKDMLEYADIIIPNHTEARLLGLNVYEDLIKTGKNYVITSIEEDSKSYTLGISDNLHKVYYEKLDASFLGTGDLFDALFINQYLETSDFNLALENTVRNISTVLSIQKENYKNDDSIIIEAILPKLKGANNA